MEVTGINIHTLVYSTIVFIILQLAEPSEALLANIRLVCKWLTVKNLSA